MRQQLTPPRLALPPDQLRSRLAAGALAPWWTPATESAVLALFEMGEDGLVRARLPFEAHMAIVDDLLDTDHELLWRDVACPVWMVGCVPGDEDGRPHKDEALSRAAEVLQRPRVLRWQGAVHDVPLQWPALVAGLVRAAVDEVSAAAPRAAAGDGQPA
jgi:hypothetical protein